MRKRTWVLYLLLIFVATVPILLLYHELGLQGTGNDLLFSQSGTNWNNVSSTLPYCMQMSDVMSLYPTCLEKISWLRLGWKSHACYAKHGVDGSICSIRRYLSEVETHCPRLPSSDLQNSRSSVIYAEPNTNLQHLFSMFIGKAENYEYISNRLSLYWSNWIDAYHITMSKYPNTMTSRRKMNVLLHMGLLAESNLHISEKSRSGGPLGELLQWTDLIACLFLLGHNLYISTEKSVLLKHISRFPIDSPCPDKENGVDLIITDIVGLRSFRTKKEFLLRNKCRIRLVDSFGTHVQFNYKSYFNAHKAELGNGTSTNPWGGHGLQLLQHWTFFPHTPDNDFLGFAVHKSEVDPLFPRNSHPLPASLVYGKELYMWRESKSIIEVLKNLTEVHATVADTGSSECEMLSGIINHGLLNATSLAALLKSINIFVGLGFPLEGPAPLEALANGAVFINPLFSPPKSRLNMNFLKEKPTLRVFTSQSPYMERLGKPHVYTVDMNDTEALRGVIEEAVKRNLTPFVPEEFTPHGMLIRVNMLISRELCPGGAAWPPHTSLVPIISAPEQSCEEACASANLVCEPSFFRLINSAELMARTYGCITERIANSTVPYAPYDCVRQESPLMFSCSTHPTLGSGAIRMCPCRDYMHQQVALCKNCVS